MSKVWVALLAAALAALASGAIAASGAPPPCQLGFPLSQGTTAISFGGGSATAVVSGWSFCGEATLVVYEWSTGATSRSISVSPGQCVSVTVSIGTNGDGLAWTQSASGCAPSEPGGPGGTACGAPNGTGRDSDGDGIDDACDPTPFPYDITPGSLTLTSESDVAGPQRVLQSATSRFCNPNARLKTREYRASWAESFLPSVTFLAFTVRYQVCYVPGNAIQWAIVFNPESPYALVPWTWLNTNDNGFPSVRVTNASATFQWQGSAAICAWHFACGPTRHPGLAITFRPNNTETRSQYVG